jgi:hypothetical protein
MKIRCLFLLLIISNSLLAQQCDCEANFRFMVDKVEKNSIHFADYIKSANVDAYRHFTDSMQQRAKGLSAPLCLNLLTNWTKYFKDGHTMLFVNADSATRVQYNLPPRKKSKWLGRNTDASFAVINDSTCMIRIPDCSMVNIPQVDSIVSTNRALIARTPHLILDLRDNLGGTVLVFQSILPLIYTGPVTRKSTSVLSTEDNLQYSYEQEVTGVSDSMTAVFKKEAVQLRAHIGSIYELWPADTVRRDTVYPYPKAVSILQNHFSVSAAELFILDARQSHKVKLYGENTLGAVDYTDGVGIPMPCPIFQVFFPSSRSNRLPGTMIDGYGIRPDVRIPQGADWVKTVCEDRGY